MYTGEKYIWWSEAEKKYNSQIEKIENIIKIQEKTIEELRAEAEKNQKAGELIYEKYMEISSLMKEIEEARKKISLQEIKSTFPSWQERNGFFKWKQPPQQGE
jgi:predicted ribosome quality control (RQC) complex YloA/Tae2 family protein